MQVEDITHLLSRHLREKPKLRCCCQGNNHINAFLFVFLMWTIFEVCWICYNVASVLCLGFLVTRLPDQGSNLHLCLGRRSLNHWITRETSWMHFLVHRPPTQKSSKLCSLGDCPAARFGTEYFPWSSSAASLSSWNHDTSFSCNIF